MSCDKWNNLHNYSKIWSLSRNEISSNRSLKNISFIVSWLEYRLYTMELHCFRKQLLLKMSLESFSQKHDPIGIGENQQR